MRWRRLAVLVVVSAGWAAAEPLWVALDNTYNAGFASGVITLKPLWGLGPTAQVGAPEYATFQYAARLCSAFSGAPDGGAKENVSVLVQRWGLVPGLDVWVTPPLDAGQSLALPIEAPADASVYFIAAVAGSTDDLVAMHAINNTASLGANTQDIQGRRFELGIYDVNDCFDGGCGLTGGCKGTIRGIRVRQRALPEVTLTLDAPALAVTTPVAMGVQVEIIKADAGVVVRYVAQPGVTIVTADGGSVDGGSVTWSLAPTPAVHTLSLSIVPPQGFSEHAVTATVPFDGTSTHTVYAQRKRICRPFLPDGGPCPSPLDAGAPDAGSIDAGISDSGVHDAGVVDAGVVDAGVVDAGVADASVADASVADASVADAGVADSGVADSGAVDAGLPVDAGAASELQFRTMGCSTSGLTMWALSVLLLSRRRRHFSHNGIVTRRRAG